MAGRWTRTQLEFISSVDQDGFVICWVAGLADLVVLQVPDELKSLPIKSIVHAKRESGTYNFKDWESS